MNRFQGNVIFILLCIMGQLFAIAILLDRIGAKL